MSRSSITAATTGSSKISPHWEIPRSVVSATAPPRGNRADSHATGEGVNLGQFARRDPQTLEGKPTQILGLTVGERARYDGRRRR
jgi:hypothetical protein